MPEKFVVRKLFEVSRELKITTSELLEFLSGAGYDVIRKQMQPVDEPMFIAILFRYDRARFNQYMIDHGIVGVELRRFSEMFEQKIQPPKPAVPEPVVVKPKPKPKSPGRPADKPVKWQTAKPASKKRPLDDDDNTTIKITVRERPVNPYVQLAAVPASIPATPLDLDLIQRLLELPHEQKFELIMELRKAS